MEAAMLKNLFSLSVVLLIGNGDPLKEAAICEAELHSE